MKKNLTKLEMTPIIMIMIIILIYTAILLSFYFSMASKTTAKKLRASEKNIHQQDDYFSFFKSIAKKF